MASEGMAKCTSHAVSFLLLTASVISTALLGSQFVSGSKGESTIYTPGPAVGVLVGLHKTACVVF